MSNKTRHATSLMEFRDIYLKNRWQGNETRSGPGSSRAATRQLGAWLYDLCQRLEVTSVLDVPCGEGKWIPDLPNYVGIDVVPEAIETARREHPDRPYFVADAVQDRLPNVDLIFSRDFMQHVSVLEGTDAISNFRRTGARFLVASSYVDGVNQDPFTTYHAYDVNLEAAPFNLGAPIECVPDGFDEHGNLLNKRKQMCVWRLT